MKRDTKYKQTYPKGGVEQTKLRSPDIDYK